MSLPNDAYGHTVIMTTDGVNDTYEVGGAIQYSFPTGTSEAAVYLSIAKQFNIAKATTTFQDFGLSRYSLITRFSLMAVYQLALLNILLVNRRAYLLQLFTWAQSLVTYSVTYMAAVNALSDPAAVAAMVPDFGPYIVSDPLVTPIAAVQINN